MVKKWLCIIGCALNCLIAGLLMVWVASYCDIADNKWPLIIDVLFVIGCVLVGIVILKLNLDKLFLKFEICGADKCDKTVLLTGLILALFIVAFAMVMIAIYFFRGVKMEPGKAIRFVLLPTLSLAHLAVGVGSYLALHYFTNFE